MRARVHRRVGLPYLHLPDLWPTRGGMSARGPRFPATEGSSDRGAVTDTTTIILTFALILTGAAFGTAIYAAWSIIRYLHHISQWQKARNDEVK